MENVPAWLETLRNVNPSLAERAQIDVERWQKLEESESKLNLQNVSKRSELLLNFLKSLRDSRALADRSITDKMMQFKVDFFLGI